MLEMYQTTLNDKEVTIKYAYNPEGMIVDDHLFEAYRGRKAGCEIVAVYACEEVPFNGGRLSRYENITGKLSHEELEELENECFAAHEDYAKKQIELRRVMVTA